VSTLMVGERYLGPLVGFGGWWQSTCISNHVIKHVCRG
jgi:hypothetical protein